MNIESIDLIALLSAEGVGPVRAKRLIDFFGTANSVLKASKNQLLEVPDIGETTANAIINSDTLYKEAQKILDECNKHSIKILSIVDDSYPSLLKEIADHPIILYWRGELKPIWEKSLAIVGTRLATAYGKKIAYQIAEDLSSNGWTVVSGLAIGIDGAAHHGALSRGIGSTVGVLGCGVNVVYPPQHRQLTEEIINKGLILSEYPPNVQPDPRFFPQRNRIISGLTKGTLVVEAGEKSGALITSSTALEQNRDVFSIPGMVTSALSRGPNRLIQKGAKLVLSTEDILNEYEPYLNLPKVNPEQILDLSENEKSLWKLFESGSYNADMIAEKLNWKISDVLGILTTLQLRGLLDMINGEYHRSVRDL